MLLAWHAVEVSVQLYNVPDLDKMFKPFVDVAYWGVSPVVELVDVELLLVLLDELTVTGPIFKLDTSEALVVLK